MFQPLPLFVGLRYVRARQHKFFVSLITWVSLLGVSLGVAALIIILSVMNGFEGELRDRLLSLSDQARVVYTGMAPPAAAEAGLEHTLRALPGVTGVAPHREVQALIVHLPEMLPVLLRGIDPAREGQVSRLESLLVQGSISALRPGSNALILGHDIADQLGVGPGDTVTLMVPLTDASGTPMPRLRQFKVAGFFDAGLEDSDSMLAIADLADVSAFVPQALGADSLALRFTDPLAVPRFMPAVRQAALAAAARSGEAVNVRDWTQDNASYFRAIRIEKTMMTLILLLIVAVAAFNIVAMLVMVVSDKRTDIAILRTQGIGPRSIMSVFVIQGLAIGWLGVAAGIALGVLVARNVGTLAPALEQAFHFHFLDADVYAVTTLPSQLQWRDVVWIGLTALLLTLISTVYPALRAARISPADALRYE